MTRDQLIKILPRADQAGVFSLPASSIPIITELADDNAFAILRVSLAGCVDKTNVLVRLAEQLEFPAWFGNNWDALGDCLTDLSWRKAAGYVLIVEDLTDFRASGDDDFDKLIEIFSDASARWSGLGIPFWGFLVTA